MKIKGKSCWIRHGHPRQRTRKKITRGTVTMRRLIYMFAAGLLAGGTVLTTAGAASAGATSARHASWRGATESRHAGCTNLGLADLRYVTTSGSYYLGTPNNLSSGAAAILKPNLNSTTMWDGCEFGNGLFLITSQNQGLALTTRSSSPGADVTAETPGNSGDGFASQLWNLVFNRHDNTLTAQNVKTGLYLRVRNSGPSMYQTVTTGNSSTTWAQP
jgi:hypothetical protein